MDEDEWEYGFYDSDDRDGKTIWWYCFGLPHKTAESAKHTGDKSVWGQTVIVRRHAGQPEWEQVDASLNRGNGGTS